MKICMVFFDFQEFGGLEEYATALAVGLQQHGHQVSMLSAAWVPPDNQYLHRLQENGIPLVQPPKWISLLASDWETKEKALDRAMWLFAPLAYLLAFGVTLFTKKSWRQAVQSGRNWLKGQLMDRVLAPDRRKPLARLLLSWWRYRWHPDLLHIHGYTTNLLFAIDWAASKHLPVAYEEHQTPDPQFDWWAGFQDTINKASRVVAVSETSALALRSVCGVTQPIVVRNPLLSDPKEAGWQEQVVAQNGRRSLVVTTVARLYVTKGLVYLLDAIVRVREKYPDTQFRVYGDGPLRQELLAHAEQLGLDGEQIFVGAFDHRDLGKIMASTDIFAMSSVLEGQPLAVVEAMAYGCPIVTTAVGGIPELIQDGVNGLLCESKDPSCLAEHIRKLIDDPSLRVALGQAARRSYEQSPFQPAAVSAYLLSVYEDMI